MEAGSWMSVVKMNVSSAMPIVARARTRIDRRAPVSWRTRRCPTVTSPKIVSATALPIEAIDDRSNAMTISRIAAAAMSRPTDARSASRRPMTGGNCSVDARWSLRPAAG